MTTPESEMHRDNNKIAETHSKPDLSVYRTSLAKASEYLNITQQKLRNGYRWDDTDKSAFCARIARDAAELLLPLGPSIIEVLGERTDGLHNDPLIPKCYDNGPGNQVIWTDHHLVAAIDDIIFDPIVGRPIDAHLYQTTVFTSPVLLRTHVSAAEMEAYLTNRRMLK